MIQRQKAGPGDQEGSGRDGIEEVEFESVASRLAEEADVPLHLGDDQEELKRGQSAPEPGQQPDGQTDTAHQFDGDGRPGEELGKGKAVAVDGGHELPDTVELLPSVVRQHRAHHHTDGQQGGPGREGAAHERQPDRSNVHWALSLRRVPQQIAARVTSPDGSIPPAGTVPCPAVQSGNHSLRLGSRRYDLSHRCLVMGILNRTPDSFYDQGATFALDLTLRRAEALVAEGADILDVGGVKAGPGPAVSEEEELDRVVPAVEALVERFDVPVSADTWNARVLAAACAAGAVVGNDISGFGDPDYLTTAARAGASVVATHIRLAPRVRDPAPQYDDLVGDVAAFLLDRAGRARTAGLDADQIVLDAGLDLGKTAAQSAVLLRESDRLASLGYPLLLSSSNKTFLGVLLDLDIDARRAPSMAATAYGVSHGCRIVRVHDVAGTVRVVRMVERILEAEAEADPSSGGTA